MSEINEKVKGRLIEQFPGVEVSETEFGQVEVKAPKEIIADLARFVREELDFDYLTMVAGVDYIEYLQLVYHIRSLKNYAELIIKVDVDSENAVVASVAPIWTGANWHEREAMDMFGIQFEGHPDPRPILLPEDWQGGHPLRKDFIDKRPKRERQFRTR